MPRSCARPACSAPAAATFTFDGLRRIVWLGPLAEASAYSAGNLCRRHAELLTPPRKWELRDVRPTPDASAAAAAPAPSRYTPPAARPSTVGAPALPSRPERATHRPAAHAAGHQFLAPAEADPPPASTSPLLARAFRNAG